MRCYRTAYTVMAVPRAQWSCQQLTNLHILNACSRVALHAGQAGAASWQQHWQPPQLDNSGTAAAVLANPVAALILGAG